MKSVLTGYFRSHKLSFFCPVSFFLALVFLGRKPEFALYVVPFLWGSRVQWSGVNMEKNPVACRVKATDESGSYLDGGERERQAEWIALWTNTAVKSSEDALARGANCAITFWRRVPACGMTTSCRADTSWTD